MEGDIWHWIAKLTPPDESIYAGGTFYIDISFRNDYPFTPPICKFITPFYHPAVMGNSKICIRSFYHWSPALKAESVLMEIYQLFTEIFWEDC